MVHNDANNLSRNLGLKQIFDKYGIRHCKELVRNEELSLLKNKLHVIEHDDGRIIVDEEQRVDDDASQSQLERRRGRQERHLQQMPRQLPPTNGLIMNGIITFEMSDALMSSRIR